MNKEAEINLQIVRKYVPIGVYDIPSGIVRIIEHNESVSPSQTNIYIHSYYTSFKEIQDIVFGEVFSILGLNLKHYTAKFIIPNSSFLLESQKGRPAAILSKTSHITCDLHVWGTDRPKS